MPNAVERIYVGCKMKQEYLESLQRDHPHVKVVELVDSDKEYKVLHSLNIEFI